MVVCVCVCMYLNVYVCAYGGQELILSVFLNCSPPYIFSDFVCLFVCEPGSLIEPGDQDLARLTGQETSEISPDGIPDTHIQMFT